MFESFVIMLREGVEAALVVGILLVATRRIQRPDLGRAVLWGLGLAVIASLGAAWALPRLPINEEAYEGVLYTVSAGFVVTMIWWMHRNARSLKGRLEESVARAESGTTRERWALGAIAFLMVFREGAETVLLLSAVSLTTDAMMAVSGTALGLALSVAFCVSFVRGNSRVDLARFFKVTECVLALFVVQLLVNGYHEFSEAGVLPATRLSMSIVGPIVRNNTIFILAVVAIPVLLLLTRRAAAAPAGEGQAAQRLALAQERMDRFWRLSTLGAAGLIFVSVGVVYAQELQPKTLPPPEAATVSGEHVVVPLASLEDGTLRRLALTAGNVQVRFLAIKGPDGKVRAALDACEICGDIGYRQEVPNLMCLNCMAEINPLTLEAGGGCNPIPVAFETADGNLRIRVADLHAAAKFFGTAQAGLEEIDPVCGMKIAIDRSAGEEEAGGRRFHFCSGRCQEAFRKDPGAYAK